jgi:hypothetical protein
MKNKKTFEAKMRQTILTISLLMFSNIVSAGTLNIGVQYDGWNSNFLQPYNGWEIWAPLSLNYKFSPSFSVYGQTIYGKGSYTDSLSGNSETIQLNNLSDSVVGGEFAFKCFSVPSILNVSFNLPTGDSTWEAKQIVSKIPTEFIDSTYFGRGFGISAMYGVSIPAGSSEIGAAAGYLYSGSYNPSYGANADPSQQQRIGDSIFLAFNRVQPYSNGQKDVIRLSGYYFLDTTNDNNDIFRLGPNLNASYGFIDPKAFSFEIGGQYYFSSQRILPDGLYGTELHDSYGPRLYFTPSYAFGDLNIGLVGKYIFANGYSTTDALYDGGGWLFGVSPTYRLKLDDISALNINAGYDFIIHENGGPDANGNLTNVTYDYWTIGTNYEIKI